jgi:hypothetical protein
MWIFSADLLKRGYQLRGFSRCRIGIGCKRSKKYHFEGKNHEDQYGDVFIFRFNA